MLEAWFYSSNLKRKYWYITNLLVLLHWVQASSKIQVYTLEKQRIPFAIPFLGKECPGFILYNL